MINIKSWSVFESNPHAESIIEKFTEDLKNQLLCWTPDFKYPRPFVTSYFHKDGAAMSQIVGGSLGFRIIHDWQLDVDDQEIQVRRFGTYLKIDFFAFNWTEFIPQSHIIFIYEQSENEKNKFLNDLSERAKRQFCVIFSRAFAFSVSLSISLIPQVMKNPELEKEIVKNLEIEFNELSDKSFFSLLLKIVKSSKTLFSKFKLLHQSIKKRFDRINLEPLTAAQLSEIRNSSPTAWSWITANRSDIEKWGTTLQADAGEYGL